MNIRFLSLALTLCAALAGTGQAFETFTDRFDGTRLDGFRWFQFNPTNAKLAQKNGRLNFTVKEPTADDFASLELLEVYPGDDENWEMTVQFTNIEKTRKMAGCGFMIFNLANRNDYFYMNFYSSFGVSSGVFTDLSYSPANKLSMASVEPIGAVRVSYDSVTRLMTFSANRKRKSGGFRWSVMGTFAPFGAPGADITADWFASPPDAGQNFGIQNFGIQLFGAAESSKVTNGKVTIDNFVLKQLPFTR